MDTLEEAILHRDCERVKAAVQELKEKCKEVGSMGRYEDFISKPVNRHTGMTALHVGCLVGDPAIVAYLLSEGPDPIRMDGKDRIPLHCAVESQNLQVVKLLVEKLAEKNWVGRTLTIRDRRELTPLHLACGNPDILDLLLQHARAPEQIMTCKGLFRHAVMSSKSNECVRLIVDKVQTVDSAILNERDTEHGKTPFILACERGCVDTAKILQGLGADISLCDTEEQNALHWACFLGHEDLKEWLEQLDTSGELATKRDAMGRVPVEWCEHEIDLSDEEVSDAPLEEGLRIPNEQEKEATGRRHSWLKPETEEEQVEIQQLAQPPPCPPPKKNAQPPNELDKTVTSDDANLDTITTQPVSTPWREDRESLEHAMAETTKALEALSSGQS